MKNGIGKNGLGKLHPNHAIIILVHEQQNQLEQTKHCTYWKSTNNINIDKYSTVTCTYITYMYKHLSFMLE